MDGMMIFEMMLLTWGVMAIVWFLTGAAILAFWCPLFIWPGAPRGAKLAIVLKLPWMIPFTVLTTGRPPIVTLAPSDDPEALAAVEKWVDDYRKEHCNCPVCRERRRKEQ